MATKRYILTQAGRELGDTSDNFIRDILSPAFDFVLAELTALEAIESVKQSATFIIEQDTREYETREICRLTPHYPASVLSLHVWAWGPLAGIIKETTDPVFEATRLTDGETQRGKPRIWRLYPNHRTLQVYPPCDADNAGAECEVAFIAPWTSIGLDDDVLDIQQEDMECVNLGLQCKGVKFSEMLQQDRMVLEGKFQAAAKRMWGRRWVHGQHLARGTRRTAGFR